jgi:ribonuclease-3
VKNDRGSTLKSAFSGRGKDLAVLQKCLDYTFKDKHLLLQAVTHSSYLFEHSDKAKGDNETLEFLGDAVLDLVVSNMLIDAYPAMDEGQLTKVRSTLVQENHLAFMARKVNLGAHLLLGKGEENSEGREKNSVLACAYEAVIGAIFRDGGYSAAQEFLEKWFRGRLEYGKEKSLFADSKSRLQEITQEAYADAPSYVLDKAEGPDHDKVFTVSVLFQGRVLATASAKSKKAAEQKAAAKAIDAL